MKPHTKAAQHAERRVDWWVVCGGAVESSRLCLPVFSLTNATKRGAPFSTVMMLCQERRRPSKRLRPVKG